jgi:RNA polymerase sigma factor (sigma-70 family)
MTSRKLKTVPSFDWVEEDIAAEPHSELEALMIGDDNWKPRDESFLDVYETVLTGKERTVVDMVVLEGLSFREVSRQLGISVGQAHALKHRAMEKLREAIRNRGDERFG